MINIGSESIFFHFRCFDYSFLVEVIERSQESLTPATTDWQDLTSNKNALTQNYQLTVSGGNDKTTFVIVRLNPRFIVEEIL